MTIALNYRAVDRLPRHNRHHLLPHNRRWTSGVCRRGRQLLHRCSTFYCDAYYVGCPVFAYTVMFGVDRAGSWRKTDYGVYVADDVAAGLFGIAAEREPRLKSAPLFITRAALRLIKQSGLRIVRPSK